jgi:uncharacterized protein (TIGR02597 family)
MDTYKYPELSIKSRNFACQFFSNCLASLSQPVPLMHRSVSLALAFVASAILVGSVSAQTVTTDPVGFTTAACPANADTLLGVPFTRLPEFTGAVQSVSGNTITVSGSPGWTGNQFVYNPAASPAQHNTYFVLIGPHASTNPNEGRIYTVTANGSNTLTVTLNGDSISGVQANTQILVVPYHTLATLFPATDANVSFIASPSQFNRQTQILIPNFAAAGINQSTGATYFYLNGAWRKFGQPTTDDHGDDVLLPTGYFTLRNAGTGTNLTALGAVLVKKEAIPLATLTSGPQDNAVSIIRPVNVTLDNLGLITSGAFASSPSQFNRIDQLFVFDNAASGINKSASGTYYYANGHWRKFGQDPTADFGPDVIAAGTGFVIRKGATVDGATQFWVNDHSPTY